MGKIFESLHKIFNNQQNINDNDKSQEIDEKQKNKEYMNSLNLDVAKNLLKMVMINYDETINSGKYDISIYRVFDEISGKDGEHVLVMNVPVQDGLINCVIGKIKKKTNLKNLEIRDLLEQILENKHKKEWMKFNDLKKELKENIELLEDGETILGIDNNKKEFMLNRKYTVVVDPHKIRLTKTISIREVCETLSKDNIERQTIIEKNKQKLKSQEEAKNEIAVYTVVNLANDDNLEQVCKEKLEKKFIGAKGKTKKDSIVNIIADEELVQDIFDKVRNKKIKNIEEVTPEIKQEIGEFISKTIVQLNKMDLDDLKKVCMKQEAQIVEKVMESGDKTLIQIIEKMTGQTKEDVLVSAFDMIKNNCIEKYKDAIVFYNDIVRKQCKNEQEWDSKKQELYIIDDKDNKAETIKKSPDLDRER